jgi:hypothetical protein
MEVGADGVALITIANPPVNALHPISKGPTGRRLPSSSAFNSAVVLISVEFHFCGLTNSVVLPNLRLQSSPGSRKNTRRPFAVTTSRPSCSLVRSLISPLPYLICSSIIR